MSLSDITDIDQVHRGSYVKTMTTSLTPVTCSTTTPVNVSNITKQLLLGISTNTLLSMSNLQTVGLTEGVISDDMKITGLSYTNTTAHAYYVNAAFQYGESMGIYGHVPPFSTVHVVTADNPISWYGGGFTISVYGTTQQTLKADEFMFHLSYHATTKV